MFKIFAPPDKKLNVKLFKNCILAFPILACPLFACLPIVCLLAHCFPYLSALRNNGDVVRSGNKILTKMSG